MAPTIGDKSTLASVSFLNDVLQRRSENKRIQKENSSRLLNKQGYQDLREQYNKTTFLSPIDSDNTKASIYYIRQKFMRYCEHVEGDDWRIEIRSQNCDKGMMMSFLHWICETYMVKRGKTGKKKTVNQYWRDFKMLYRRVNGRFVDPDDRLEVVKYTNGYLKKTFGLDVTSKPKPVAGADDLLLLLVQHWARDQSVFPTEDDRLNLPTMMLFQSYTGCRPAELSHASKGKACLDPLGEAEDDSNRGSRRRSRRGDRDEGYSDDGEDIDDYKGADADGDNGYHSDDTDVTMTEDTADCYAVKLDEFGVPVQGHSAHYPLQLPLPEELRREYKALCYEDVGLWIIQNPKQGERDVLAMEVHLRHHKGVDNKPKPTTFLFREHPLPILCPITHILARAILDDAIEVNGYTSAEPFFSTNLFKDGVNAAKVHWKPSKMKTPLFRRSKQTAGGRVRLDEPISYPTYAHYLDRLAQATGLEEKLTTYCFRRGTANAVDGAAPDAVRDQVMRHNPYTGVFNEAYLNHIVRFNVQGAFLEEEITDDGLDRAFTHMSLRCNPGVPKDVPQEVLDALPPDPEIAGLEILQQQRYKQIRHQYHFIYLAPPEIQKEYDELIKALQNARKSLKDEINKAFRKDYFYRAHNHVLERQLDKNPVAKGEDVEPVIQHQLEERIQVQYILCDLSKDLSVEGIIHRKIQAVNALVALGARQELMTRKPPASTSYKTAPKVESPSPDPDPIPPTDDFPVICQKTQCIFCLGNEKLSHQDRIRTFSRVSHMMDHVERVHMREPVERFVCDHPICRLNPPPLKNVTEFKSHVARCHGINLRSRESDRLSC